MSWVILGRTRPCRRASFGTVFDYAQFQPSREDPHEILPGCQTLRARSRAVLVGPYLASHGMVGAPAVETAPSALGRQR